MDPNRYADDTPFGTVRRTPLAELGISTGAAGGPRGQLRWRAEEILAVLIDE